MHFPQHLWCSSVRSKTQSFHRFSVNFVIEILASRISYLIPHHFPPCFIANEFRQLSSLKKAIQKKIFAIQKQFSHWNRFLIISKIYNLVILNEAQRSEESLHKAKYFKITSSHLHNFTTSQLRYTSRTSPIFLSALKNAIISHHLRELCDRNTRISYLIPHQFPHRFIANEFRQLCFLNNIGIIKNLCV